MIEVTPEAGLSVNRQCVLLGVARSSFYYRPRPESAAELDLLKRLDRIFTDHPVYGSRRLQVALLREGMSVGRRRVRRLMRKLGLWAVRPKRNTSKRHPAHKGHGAIRSFEPGLQDQRAFAITAGDSGIALRRYLPAKDRMSSGEITPDQ
jgi:transposase InsO family protein